MNGAGIIILHPYVSEKASNLEKFSKYVFKVSKKATKPEVKKTIQAKYGVKAISIRMTNIPAKKRTVGRHQGVKSGFRKAIVTLTKGETISIK
ncbi:MAG: 50S ribosomal protein L23 [Candidatus Yanofskybacteria bacterium RIFCSPHIGHO2_01_FULL_48_25b]|uniref:Large ribosomal subunit protein uL23 n=1 Tax=Candidatus Yanofskybacteria bacterium RIFCSPHIGHO2_01_FULL_48_25b TaxID=1802672 RepID=A0A1F8F0Y2_9BACT|nr:MAG: 50S ribosomal protein L23 [Candidatus Yanofskybacteria bacterium RIFCSPHIGHO2_01_FULL_48_25b]